MTVLIPTYKPAAHPKISATFQLLLASLFIGLCAQIKIPLYFTPVALTGQTFGVLLVGALLGSRKGALAAVCYLLEGSLGLPVWAGGAAGFHHLMGLTGGYRLAYVLQAFLVGWSLEKTSFHFVKTTSLFFLICCLQLVLGTLWMAHFVGFNNVWMLGVYPFIPGELLKSLIVTAYVRVKNVY